MTVWDWYVMAALVSTGNTGAPPDKRAGGAASLADQLMSERIRRKDW